MSLPPVDASSGSTEPEVERLAAMARQALRQIRILQWSFLGLVILVAGTIGGLYAAGSLHIEGLSPPVVRRVEAKEIGFYNRFDTRVILEADDKWGLPQLIFMDLKKRYRLGIKVWPEGDGTPGMVFYDQGGMRGNFRIDEDGTAVLNLVGEGEKGRKGGIALAVTPNGTPTLKLTDKTGKVLFQAPAASD